VDLPSSPGDDWLRLRGKHHRYLHRDTGEHHDLYRDRKQRDRQRQCCLDHGDGNSGTATANLHPDRRAVLDFRRPRIVYPDRQLQPGGDKLHLEFQFRL
jgi:hypothetical protein